MKSNRSIIVPIFQTVLGLLAIVSLFAVTLNGEDIKNWILTLVLAAVFIVLGVVGIIRYTKTEN